MRWPRSGRHCAKDLTFVFSLRIYDAMLAGRYFLWALLRIGPVRPALYSQAVDFFLGGAPACRGAYELAGGSAACSTFKLDPRSIVHHSNRAAGYRLRFKAGVGAEKGPIGADGHRRTL